MIHCCELMADILNDLRIQIGYDPKYNEYYIETHNPMIIYVMDYCPWCGEKLPESLNDKWYEILEKEYNLDDPDREEQEKLVPEEFKSDQWWKKRGL